MARIRSLHPGFFTDEEIVTTSMGARLLLLGLGVEADDKGIFEWKPSRIKMRIFPVDNVFVPDLLLELCGIDVVRQYEIDGRHYGAIRNFRRHQRPKTPNDIHPAPSEIRNYVGLAAPVTETATADDKAIPRKGEKGKRKPAEFPPNGEKSPQMEDGGWRRGDPSLPEGSTTSQDRDDAGDCADVVFRVVEGGA